MAMTVSMSVGRVAIMHDIRKEISANVDVSLSCNNEIFIDKLAPYNYDVEAYTNATFQPHIDEYNIRQTRENRKKDKPYVEYIKAENDKLLQKAEDNKRKGIKVATRKPTKLCHEYVLQFGNRDDNGIMTGADIDRNREAAKKTLEDIQKKYPHAEILLATFHADEPNGTPHMHILVQFVGEGYEKGLSRQISMSKALENDGLERCQNRGDYAINRWTKDIQDSIMTENLRTFFVEDREILDEKRGHEDIRFFRAKAKREAEAVKELRVEAEQLQNQLDGYEEKMSFGFDMDFEEIIEEIHVPGLREQVSEAEEQLDLVKGRIKDLKTEYEEAVIKYDKNSLEGEIEVLKKEKETLQHDVKSLKEKLNDYIGIIKKAIKGLWVACRTGLLQAEDDEKTALLTVKKGQEEAHVTVKPLDEVVRENVDQSIDGLAEETNEQIRSFRKRGR